MTRVATALLSFARSGISLILIASFARPALATPQVIRVDGSVFDNSGAPTSGSKDIQIKLYSAATGGSALWTSSTYNTTVSSGRFSINLDGATLAPYLAALSTSGAAYFEVIVDSGTANGSMDTPIAVAPRIRSRGTAFALAASSADALYGVTTTTLELNRVAGVTSAVQSQLNAKVSYPSGGADGQVLKFNAGNGTFYWGTAGGDLNVGNDNTIGGYLAGVSVGSGSRNTYIGSQANSVDTDTASDITSIGYAAQANVKSVAVGSQAVAYGATVGIDQPAVAIGHQSFASIGSVAVGPVASATASGGTAVGWKSTANQFGTAIGLGTKANRYAVSLGAFAGWNQTSNLSSYNVLIGESAGSTVSSGIMNTVLGGMAGSSITGGNNNTLLGSYSGGTIAMGANNTLIGVSSDGTADYGTSLGFAAVVTANSAVQLGGGTNSTANSLQFNGYNFLRDTGAATFASINGVTTVGYLSGVTANIQTQLNSLASGGSNLAIAGGTMTGGLGLNYAGASASGVVVTDAARKLQTSTVVDLTELSYLDGVTSALDQKVNRFTATEAGYLAGVTSSLTKMNAFSATEAGYLAGVTASLAKTNSFTATEATYLAGVTSPLTKTNSFTATEATYISGVTSNIGAKLNQVSVAEVGYVVGVTSSLNKVNSFTAAEATYVAGVTAGIQAQLQRLWGSSCSAGYYLSGLDISGNFVCTALPSNVYPVKVTSSGGQFNAALFSDGTILTLGANANGQLGNGGTTASAVASYVRDSDGTKFTASNISAGARHMCALKSNGTVWCWGYNGTGGLGDNTVTSSSVPVQMVGITNAVQVSTAGDGTCVRLATGSVRCTGYNGYGGLGDGTTTDRATAVPAIGVTTAVDVSCGYYSACAVLANGTAKCWGYNGTYQLGDNTITTRSTPTVVMNLTGLTAIAHGSNTSYGGSSCALKSNGTIWCWGYNGYGNLGTGDATNRVTPQQVIEITTAVKIGLGMLHTCALLSNGTVKCWGYNGYGGLGDGTVTTRYTPTFVLSTSGSGTLTGVTELSVGDDSVWSYGNVGYIVNGRWMNAGGNAQGQLGNGNTTDSYRPVGVQTPF